MLDIQDLHVRFRSAPAGKEAVKGISLHMNAGEILGLVGESGSGKTVTAMALAGLLSNAKVELSGHIFFEGLDLLRASRETVRSMRGRDIAVVFQEPMTSMDPVMRIGPQIEESLRTHTKLSRAERAQMIDQLKKEMKNAAKLLEFEHAAYLRDKINKLKELK